MSSVNIETRTFLLPSSVSYSEVVHRTDYSKKIVFLTLNRPNRCNALSLELLDSLLAHLEEIAKNPQYQILILNGNGRHFCSGLDLHEAVLKEEVLISKEDANLFPNELERKSFFRFVKNSNDDKSSKTNAVAQGYWMPHRLLEILLLLKKMPQFVIAAVHGAAYGGGAGIVAACDFVLASHDFRLSFPELKYGLPPSLLFPFFRRKIAPPDFRRAVLTSLPIDSQRARDLKLVQEIVSFDELIPESLEYANAFCFGETEIVARTKGMINESEIPSNDELQKALAEHWKYWNTPETEERINAFFEKRSITSGESTRDSEVI
ncbi:MAG: enoyl-CoA hydratase/isomerase family protein [Planctomycetia bacterium]|nr:enoyl-CoA hydratase/isomerase family protein [Planctomycetia bacterium]